MRQQARQAAGAAGSRHSMRSRRSMRQQARQAAGAACAACGSRRSMRQQARQAAGAACGRRSMCQAEKAAGAAGSRWGGGLQFDRFLLEGAWGVTYCGFPTAAVRALPWYVLVMVPYMCLRRVCLPCEQGKLRWARERGRTVHSVLGPALVGPTLKRLPFSYATHKGITAQRHFKDYSSSNATRRALPTACLELGQGGAVEMGANARKQGVAMNEGDSDNVHRASCCLYTYYPPKKSPRIRALLKQV